MIPTSFIAPVRDNDGKLLRRSVHAELRGRLMSIAGGFTALNCEGQWQDASGRTYKDKSLRYEAALASWEDLPGFLDLLRWLCLEARQLEVFYTVAGIAGTIRAVAPQTVEH